MVASSRWPPRRARASGPSPRGAAGQGTNVTCLVLALLRGAAVVAGRTSAAAPRRAGG